MDISFCSAIIGFLCIQAPIGGTTTVQLEDQGLYVSNVIQAKSWKASWGRSMEWPAPKVDAKRMDEVCVKDVCRAYFRQCDDLEKLRDCTFVIASKDGSANIFRIEAPDDAGMTEALSHVGAVVQMEPLIVFPAGAMDKQGRYGALPLIPVTLP